MANSSSPPPPSTPPEAAAPPSVPPPPPSTPPEAAAPPSVPPIQPPSIRDKWKEKILYPTLLGGIVGGAIGTVSKHRKVYGVAAMSATYATNLAIVAGVYCGTREFMRVTLKTDHGDLINSALAGIGSGGTLGRLQGGQLAAIRYAIVFAIVGTGVDYATLKLQPLAKNYYDSLSFRDLKLPEWSPIQILDEEALAAKRAREEKLRAQSAVTIRTKES